MPIPHLTARRYVFAVLLVLSVEGTTGLRDDAVSLLQSSAHHPLQPNSSKEAPRSTQHFNPSVQAKRYVKGETAEVKSTRFDDMLGIGGWVICHIIGPGTEENTYDIVIPGTTFMKDVPFFMLRKRPKAEYWVSHKETVQQLLAPNVTASFMDKEGSIDGQPGERVEILVTKGPKAGSWVRGTVVRAGTWPDCFDINIPKKDGGSKLLVNVPGGSLRKVEEVLENTYENYTYQVGDRVQVNPMGKKGLADGWYSAVIIQQEGPDKFYIYMQGIGYLSGIPKKAMRPKQFEGFKGEVKKDAVLTDSVFRVGEDVETKVVEGPLAGIWLKARIASRGIVPFTYRVNMTQWKLEDLVNIFTYHELLRRPGQALSRAAITTFERNEKIEFKIISEKTTYNNVWLNGTVDGKGQAPDTYDVVMTPSGKQIISLPVELMRKVYFDPSTLPRVMSRDYKLGEKIEYRNALTGYWNWGWILGPGGVKGTYDLDAGDAGMRAFIMHNDTTKEAQDGPGTRLYSVPPEIMRRIATSYQPGDTVEVVSGKKDENGHIAGWVRGIVKGLGQKADTYEIVLEDHGEERGLWHNVPFDKLRQACSVAQRDLLKAYEVEEKVEMLSLHGDTAGDWVPAKVAGKGIWKFTYNLTIRGMAGLSNVPIELLRKVPSSRFKVGEFVKVKVTHGPLLGTWAVGLVAGQGTLEDMFNISYWNAGMVPDQPLALIQKGNQPFRPEKTPVFEAGESVRVLATIGPDKGKWIPGTIKETGSMIENTTAGPRPQTYTISLPTHAEVGDIKDVAVELIAKDDLALRPLSIIEEFKVNETVRIRGVVGARGAPWVKVFVVKNGTKRDSYDVHMPGVGVFENVPIEWMRRVGVPRPHMEYQVGQAVEMKDVFDLGDETNLWYPVRIRGKGKRPETYDVSAEGVDIALECIPVEILRRADGREFRPIQRIYYPREIVEVKDVLGIFSLNSTTKAVFRIVGKSKMPRSYDIEGTLVGLLKDVPAMLLKRVPLKDALVQEEDIDLGDWVECNDVDKPGHNVTCIVDSVGERPGTFNVRIHGYGGLFPNIPTSRLQKKAAPVLPSLAALSNKDNEAAEAPEMKVGDRVEVYDKRKRENNWVQATIFAKGRGRRSWDVKIGDLGIFRNVPEERVRPSQEKPQSEIATTTAPRAEKPLGMGDIVHWVGPGYNATNASTTWSGMVLDEGTAPGTVNLVLDSGFTYYNVPINYIARNKRYYVTTTNVPDIVNSFSTLGNVMPTIKLFQAMIKKDTDEWVLAHEGDAKGQMQQEYRGKELGDGSVTYAIGEQAEVYVPKGEYKGSWVACIITGFGRWANSYNIHVPEAEASIRDVPNVGSKMLRKVGGVNDPEAEEIRAASPCSEDDRRNLQRVLENDGMFDNNPEECSKVMNFKGINHEAVGKCIEKKFSLSDRCVKCPVDFSKALSNGDMFRKNCMAKCIGMLEACHSGSSFPSCKPKARECYACAQGPLDGLLRCLGTAGTATSVKLGHIAEALPSDDLWRPGGVREILGADWVERHHRLLKPIFVVSGIHIDDSAPAAPTAEDPGLLSFEVGDKAEIRVQKGQYAGMWVECDITGRGRAPGTYDIHIPGSANGQQDFRDVSVLILRRNDFGPEEESSPKPEQSDQDPL